MKTKRILRMSLVITCVAVLFCGCKNTIQSMRKETEKNLSINVTYSGVVKQSEMDTFLTPNVYPRAEDQKAVFFTFHFDNQTDISFSNLICRIFRLMKSTLTTLLCTARVPAVLKPDKRKMYRSLRMLIRIWLVLTCKNGQAGIPLLILFGWIRLIKPLG